MSIIKITREQLTRNHLQANGMNANIVFQQALFLKGATNLAELPADQGYEVALIGRSNAGKSSALNAITGLKGLARTSKTPGRTQMMNLFALDTQRRLVDLPGYGYAQIPLLVKERWTKMINDYLAQRQCLRGLLVIMDIRHPLKDSDRRLLEWGVACQVPLHILLTKADKLTLREARQSLNAVEADLQQLSATISVQLFSALEKIGVDEVRSRLSQWLQKSQQDLAQQKK